MNDILDILWDSTDELHKRFDKFPPNASETLRVFEEESLEFGEAAAELYEGNDTSVSDVCAEAADTIVTILATLTALGVTREDFAKWALAVAEKNDAKTHDTHSVNPVTGKIQRKVKAP